MSNNKLWFIIENGVCQQECFMSYDDAVFSINFHEQMYIEYDEVDKNERPPFNMYATQTPHVAYDDADGYPMLLITPENDTIELTNFKMIV